MPSREFEKFYQSVLSKTPKAGESPRELRENFEKMMETFPCADDITTENVSIGNIPAIRFIAPNATRDKVLLFFHAGGYTAGSPHSHRDLLGRLSHEIGATVLATRYRLAPEDPFPAAFEDACSAYDWLLTQIPAQSIFLGGLSAGGGLVLALLLHLKQNNKTFPLAGICLCPWIDLTMKSRSLHLNEDKDIISRERLITAKEMYVKDHDPKNPSISPIYGDLSGLPPLLIQTGTSEILYDEAVEIAQMAQKSGVKVTLEQYEQMFHAWQLFAAKIPEGDKAIKNIGLFCHSLLPIYS